jgi:hypothetical protein
LSNSIKTEHRGKGSFSFKHLQQYQSLYVQFTSQQSK